MKVNYSVKYYIDKEKKVVVCKLTGCEENLMSDIYQDIYQTGYQHHSYFLLNDSYVGKAKCSENDTFDIEFGKKLAYQRAVVKLNTAKVKILKRFEKEQVKYFNQLLDDMHKTSDKCERIIASKETTIKGMLAE